MNNLELLSQFKTLLGEMSYYNASESNWIKETTKRNTVKNNLKQISTQLIKQGMKSTDIKKLVNQGDYLVCPLDYMPKERI